MLEDGERSFFSVLVFGLLHMIPWEWLHGWLDEKDVRQRLSLSLFE